MTAAIPNPLDDSRYLPTSYSTAYEASGVTWTARCAGCGRDAELHGDKHGVITTDCPCDPDPATVTDSEKEAA